MTDPMFLARADKLDAILVQAITDLAIPLDPELSKIATSAWLELIVIRKSLFELVPELEAKSRAGDVL